MKAMKVQTLGEKSASGEDISLLRDTPDNSSRIAAGAALVVGLLLLNGLVAYADYSRLHSTRTLGPASSYSSSSSSSSSSASSSSSSSRSGTLPLLSSLSDPTACVQTKNVALSGYDTVAYFSLEDKAAAVLGSSDYAATYHGYTYYFSTAANQKLFEKEPEAYVPQFGGFCAYGISSETFWTAAAVEAGGPAANPDVYLVRDGKLYLFM